MTLPTVITNFEADYIALMYERLAELGVNLEPGKGIYDVSHVFWNAVNRNLPVRPRKVHVANEFEEPTDPDAKRGLPALRAKFERGDDLNPHLSKDATKPKRKPFNDQLLIAWGIHHFHLGEVPPAGKHAGRTDFVLFAMVKDDDAYFLDVLPHEETPGKKNWSRQDLLERVLGNWPSLLKEIKGMGKGRPVTDEEVETVRGKGGNVAFISKEGVHYFPPGGGRMASGISFDVRLKTDRSIASVQRAEAWVRENVDRIVASLERAGHPIPDPLKLNLVLDGNNILCREPSSNHHMLLPESLFGT